MFLHRTLYPPMYLPTHSQLQVDNCFLPFPFQISQRSHSSPTGTQWILRNRWMRHVCCFIAEIWLQKESSTSISFGIKNSKVWDSRREGNFWGPHGWRGSLELQNPREKALPKSWHYSRLQGSSTKWSGDRMQCLLVINKSIKFQKSYCTGDVSTQSDNLKLSN